MEVVELAADARIQRRVGGHAGKGAPTCRFFDFVKIGGVEKELHFFLLYMQESQRRFGEGPYTSLKCTRKGAKKSYVQRNL